LVSNGWRKRKGFLKIETCGTLLPMMTSPRSAKVARVRKPLVWSVPGIITNPRGVVAGLGVERKRKNALGSQRNPLKTLDSDKRIKGNPSLFL
jgi:hypothetical protein